MSPALPYVGGVVHVVYVWRTPNRSAEPVARPCVIALVDTESSPREKIVGLCPITRTAPGDAERAILLARTVYAPLGLGRGRCWIITSELTTVAWSATTLRPTSTHDGHYGVLSPTVTREVKRSLLRNHRDGALREAQQDD